MRRGIQLRYLNRSGEWPSGNPRFYFRRPGGKNYPMPDLPADDPAFLKAYAETAEKSKAPASAHAKGSIGEAMTAYMASKAFAKMSAATRQQRRRFLDDIRKRYGAALIRDLLPRHIRKDLAPFDPHPANNRLKAWRGFTRWLVEVGRLDLDPAREVRKPSIPGSDGFTAATWEDALTFRARWPVGTPQRLAMEAILRTGASIGDLCRIGLHMVADGWLTYERGKSGSLAVIPWDDPPAWALGDDLDACLAVHPHLMFMVTETGKPRSEKAAAAWFSRACTEAGLPDLSAHSFRKLKAARMKEMGATPEQRMAILGHETRAEASRYAKSADLRRVITGTEVPTRVIQMHPTRKKV